MIRAGYPLLLVASLLAAGACRRSEPEPQPAPATTVSNLIIITIDTLRADRVGTYGYRAARTPAMDALAQRGVRFDRAFATTPITLPSHASLMTGRYPPGHGSRDNGMRIDLEVPTLADTLARAGFETGAFVTAFPLDRRFGLIKGFRTYSDAMPRGANGRPNNERPGDAAMTEALAWLADKRGGRYFLWVHLFEPHAPYGPPGDRRSVQERYDAEVAESDRQIARLLNALQGDLSSTLVIVTADHGEAFGEHGEVAHSIFVYDTTLRIPLLMAGGPLHRREIAAPVSLADVAPTALRLLGVQPFDVDGIDLRPIIDSGRAPDRELYAESFAPLLAFGWSPLRALRTGGWKYIDAPRPELYHVDEDRGEERERSEAESPRMTAMRDRLQRYSSASLEVSAIDPETRGRLQALGYVAGGKASKGPRPDPKDRRDLIARLAQVTSGELQGRELETALRQILKMDRGNPQANLRLGYVLQDSGRCGDAVPHFKAAIASRVPTADAHLGLAACEAAAGQFDAAATTLREAERVEPDNPLVAANLGIVLSDGGAPLDGIPHLQRALTLDPEFHQARFNLAIAFARAERRDEAAAEARELLRRLPADAPQRPEVQRLLDSVSESK